MIFVIRQDIKTERIQRKILQHLLSLMDAFLCLIQSVCIESIDHVCSEEPKPPASVCRSGGRSGHMKSLGGQHGPWARVRGTRGHQTRGPGSRGHVCLISGHQTRVWGAQGACEPPFGARPGPEECGMLWVFIDWVQREEQPAGVMIKLDSRSGEREGRNGRQYRHL